MKGVDEVLLAWGHPVVTHDFDIHMLSLAADGYADDPHLSTVSQGMRDDMEALLDDSRNPERALLAWEIHEYVGDAHGDALNLYWADGIGPADLCRLLPCGTRWYRERVEEARQDVAAWATSHPAGSAGHATR